MVKKHHEEPVKPLLLQQPRGRLMGFAQTFCFSSFMRTMKFTLVTCPRCYLEDGASKGAWLNRSSIIFAGSDKWSVDPRVSIATANRREYSLQIQDVDVTDDGPYTCSVQTQHTPRTMQVHLTVQVSPKIFRISSDIVVNEGSNVTLVCLATGKPEPSISWRHISPS
ncbi:PREDICTED: neuronal growth regulator 1-like, partial [Nestor notabilis]|uniref:neuronal growth regulator 1-like n=1 Tax=Nestor notabilis TaxID=176057 RepID=UPI00052392B5